MKQIINSERIPIKLWLDSLESGVLEQARNLANLPFSHHHIAIMPDAHQGYGMPIGGVMAACDVVIPNAVGVDIGCGMCAVRTSLTDISHNVLKQVLDAIRRVVPLGFKHHKKRQSEIYMPAGGLELSVVASEYGNALTQLGTLGGGNHFIEIQQADDHHIWIMIHSGSRNLGFKVANHFNRTAIALNKKMGVSIPKNWQLDFLPLDAEEGQQYLREMSFCVEFALANRRLMMERVQRALQESVTSVTFQPLINIAHNYAAAESHFGRQVIVHRKGATRAHKGEIGIIPGSQGTKSYIVSGKGSVESFQSCSHGAGRIMGRKQAQRQLDFAQEKKHLDDLGVLHAIRDRRDLDEAAGAYKDITEVIRDQEDLVDIVTELRPLAVIKG